MNRILLEPGELEGDGTAALRDGRAEHIRGVLRARPGDRLRTGTLGGAAGWSTVLEVGAERVVLRPAHAEEAPAPWFDLLLACPRPKALKRLWPQLASLGAGRIVVLNAHKVEKCYFSTQWLDPAHVRPLLVEGLSQAGLTRPPEVLVRERFKPFVEDELDALFPGALRLLAHPGARTPPPGACRTRRPLLAVGPEGGWTEYERGLLAARGFQAFSLGGRTLRTDTACVALIAVLDWWRASGE